MTEFNVGDKVSVVLTVFDTEQSGALNLHAKPGKGRVFADPQEVTLVTRALPPEPEVGVPFWFTQHGKAWGCFFLRTPQGWIYFKDWVRSGTAASDGYMTWEQVHKQYVKDNPDWNPAHQLDLDATD